jgi:Flp pilus assembly protein TadG
MPDLFLRLNARLTDCVRDRRAVSAVEFAILLPLMVTLYLGSVEVFRGISAKRDVTMISHSIADLASQYSTIHDQDMTNILAAASAIMAPFSTGPLQATVSELTIDSKGNATVVWSDTLNGSKLAVGAAVTVPSGPNVPNSYVLLATVKYAYDPVFGYVLTSTINMSDQIYMAPRQSGGITRTSP